MGGGLMQLVAYGAQITIRLGRQQWVANKVLDIPYQINLCKYLGR